MWSKIEGRGWLVAALILLLAGSFWVRERGIEWPLLHPDEYKITHWAAWIEKHTQTESAAYPGGYFHLIKPVLLLRNTCSSGADAWSEFQGHRIQPVKVDDDGRTFFLRKINVVLALLTIWLVYGLARRVSGSAWAALAATGLLAFSRLHVVNSHYAETDIAMLFTLTLALYLWVRVFDSAKVLWFAMAALLTGLAIGTKYTNLLLLVQMGVGGWVCWQASEQKTPGKAAKLLGFGLLLVACGWCYSNRHIFEGLDFWRQLQRAGQATYAERGVNLGASAVDPYAMLRSNWSVLVDNLADIHWGWLSFMVVGAALSGRPKYRRYWPVTLFPIILYLIYCLKIAPWIRGQECLVFFPFMTTCLAIGVKESMAWANRNRFRVLSVSAILLVLLVAGGDSLARSLRFSSLCEVPEPRIQALRWLYCHAPLHKKTGIEAYTVPACRLFDNGCSVEQIEWLSPDQRDRMQMDYLLRNVSACGRGTVDPRTRALYPNYAANLADFKQKADLLCEWGPREPNFEFVGTQMEWWYARPDKAVMAVKTPMFRPALINHSPSVVVPLSESEVGSSAGLFVDTTPRSMIVSGSSAHRRTVYIVLQTKERAGDVIVNGMGDRHVVHIDPYDVKVVEVCRPWYWPRISEYDEITVHARAQPHVEYLPCYAQAVTDIRDVALLLYQKGYPDLALEWLTRSAASAEEAWLWFSCAVEQGLSSLAERYEPLARQTLANFEKIRQLAPEQVSLNGVSGSAYRDHSMIRLPLMDTGRDGIQMSLPEWIINMESGETGKAFTAPLKVPVRLAPGLYTVQGNLTVAPPFELTQPWRLNVGDTSRTGAVAVIIEPGQRSQWRYSFVVREEQDLELTFSSNQRGGRLALTGLEIQWNGNDLLWAERRELYRALIRYAAHAGQTEGAGRWLEAARHSVPDEEGWLGVEHEVATSTAQPGPNGIVFYPWLKLVQAAANASKAELHFEVLKDNIPALEMVAYRKKMGGPRKIHKALIAAHSVRKGEQVTFTIPLITPCPVSDLYIRVQADVEWGAAPLHVDGVRNGRVRLK